MDVTEALTRLEEFAAWAMGSKMPRLSRRAKSLARGVRLSAAANVVQLIEKLPKDLRIRVEQTIRSQDKWMAPERLHREKLAAEEGEKAKKKEAFEKQKKIDLEMKRNEKRKELKKLYMRVRRAAEKYRLEHPSKPKSPKEIKDAEEQRLLDEIEMEARKK